MRRVRAVAALLLALLLAACTGVPTSGPVERVSAQPGRVNPGVEIAPAPPGEGASPIEVVEGFLHALASWQPDYEVARQYLTPEASAAWDPEAGVRIYAEGNPVVASETGARLRAPVVGTLDPSGAYQQSTGELDHDFGLVADAAGQWRIARPPQGLIISEYLFSSAFTRTLVYFFAPGASWLVPDPRYFPRGQRAIQLASRAVVAGPADWLAPAVEAPAGGVTVAGVLVDDGGVATVTLERGEAGDLDADARAALATRYAWTLRQFGAVTGFRLGWADEPPWLIDAYEATIPTTAFPDADPHDRQTSRQLFAVAQGRLVRAVEGPQGMQGLSVAPGVSDAAYAAVRPDALQAAAVVAGRSSLVVSGLSEPTTEPVIAAIGLRRPHYARQGELWVLDDAGALTVVAPDGETTPVAVAGLREGRVTALRLAPDGVRVALVVQDAGAGVVGVARVTRAEGFVLVDGWREVALSTSAVGRFEALDVGWRSDDALLVLASDSRVTSVHSVLTDGAGVTPIGPVNLDSLVELAVAPGVPAMVRTREGEVLRYNADFRWSSLALEIGSIFYP